MELHVLGSSSKGNCYVLQNGTEALVIECGVPLLSVKQVVGFYISKISGALISHEHGDHSRYADDFSRNRIPLYMSRGTAGKMNVKNKEMIKILKPKKLHKIGNFNVIPFEVQHDAEQPFGFLINHSETGNILFVTDSFYLKYKFPKLNNILIECNYKTEILRKNVLEGRIPDMLLMRTLKSHMSYDTCVKTLQANDLSQVNNIILIHLSDANSNADEFRRGIEKETGKTVYVAERGLKLKFNKIPF